MAAGIVDDLELIEVYVQQRIRAFAALRAQDRRMQAIVEFAAIDEPGEGVVTRLIGERPFEAAFLRDVVENDDGADDQALPVADGSRRLLNSDFLAGPRDENGMIHRGARLAAAERADQRVFDRLAGDLVHEIQHIADGPAARLREAPRREALGHRIDVLDATVS